MATLSEQVMRLFGWQIERATPSPEQVLPSIVPEIKDEGAIVVAAGGSYGTYIDLDGAMRTDGELITRYRDMTLYPEIDDAVQQICNEAIVQEDKVPVVRVNLDELPYADPIKKLIEDEFDTVLKLLEWGEHCYDIFRQWYVDGRLYYQAIIDPKNPGLGVQKLQYIDPRKIRKIREVKQIIAPGTGVITGRTVSEYFMYNDKGWNGVSNMSSPNSASNVVGAYRIAKDSIVYTTSGLTDTNRSTVLGFLHKAIKPLNQLREMEDSTVIYRISRAPARRVFYIEVGDLPKAKAEQHIQNMMTKHKNRLVYDASTGEIRDDRKFATMLEDYWFARRSGQSGTEVQQLQEGGSLLHMEDVEYFRQRLNRSLNVPVSRLNPETPFPFDASSVVSRDEMTFNRFIERMRLRFNHLFLEILKRQLILKKIISEADWDQIKQYIKFDYARDNYFAELKDMAIQKSRLEVLGMMVPYAGKIWSWTHLRKKVLKQSDDDIKQNTVEIIQEMQDPLYASLYFPNPNAEEAGPASSSK